VIILLKYCLLFGGALGVLALLDKKYKLV